MMLSKLKRFVSNADNAEKAVSNPWSPGVSNALPSSLQRKFARGVSYNLKIIVKGDRNVGKSALLDRLQGLPFCEEYTPTDEIKVVNINWDHKLSDEIVKVELWEAVDKAKKRESRNLGDIERRVSTLKTSNSSDAVHSLACYPELSNIALDAESIDVYRGASGVIVVIDLTKKWTCVEYLIREASKIPPSLPVLVLANHKDMYHHAVVSAEQVRAVMHEVNAARCNAAGSSPAQQPSAFLYAESSMRNGFGLRLIDKFFSIPFLCLQRATLLAQLETNARDVRAMHQELACVIDSNEQNYDAFIDDLSRKRRTAADEHASSGSVARQLSSGSHNSSVSKPISPVPTTNSIISTVPVKELMSNPKYKIEYPTMEQQISWNQQQQQQQMVKDSRNSSSTKSSSPSSGTNALASAKGRPSIIVGRGQLIPGSSISSQISPAVIHKSLSETLPANQQKNAIPPAESGDDDDDDDEYELVMPGQQHQQQRPKILVNNPMVSHAVDSDDDNISVDYQQAGITAGEALDAVESRILENNMQRSSGLTSRIPGLITNGSPNEHADAVSSVFSSARTTQAVDNESQSKDEYDKMSANDRESEGAISDENENSKNALDNLAETVRHQSAGGVLPSFDAPLKLKTTEIPKMTKTLRNIDEGTKKARNVVAADSTEEAKKPVTAKKRSKTKRLVNKTGDSNNAVNVEVDGNDAMTTDIYKDYEPI